MTPLPPVATIDKMKFAHRTVQAVFVWSTAVTTLFANAPHFDCVCPNGDHKPFCFVGLFTPVAGCCCGSGSCCSSSPSENGCQTERGSPTDHVGKRPCCYKNTATNHDTNKSGSDVTGRCCQKTFVTGNFAVVPVHKTTVKQDSSNVFAIVLLQDALVSYVPTGDDFFFSRPNSQPPPTDLVISLQHFLI